MDEQNGLPGLSLPLPNPAPCPAPEKKHSGPGIVSFVLSLLAGLSFFTLLAIGIAMAMRNPEFFDDEGSDSLFLVIGLLGLVLGVVDVVALVLGIVGLCQKERKKLFAILGTVCSVLVLLLIAGLFLLGSAA